ncbi:MAG: UPF0158 family protein [Rhodothermaceae bacterium]|nr:UPF0158 family protein [Rhodothermaceae bacterium]
MISISSDDLTRIAEDLLTGMRVFVHKQTVEIIIVPNEMNLTYADPEIWETELNLLENYRFDYLEIDAMNSKQSFEVMEDFAGNLVENRVLRVGLLNALNCKKPFREFKYVIDNAGKYREQWFSFRLEKTMDFVKKQLANMNRH